MSHKQGMKLEVQRHGEELDLIAELEIEATPEEVWKAITEGDEISSWFAFQARSEPGEGGHIWMSWDGDYEGSQPILTWEEERRLRTGWRVPLPDGEVAELVVEYTLEGSGGTTLLRLVHSGFSAADDWDEIVDSHRRGWSTELRSLRHYLENHRSKRRGVVKAEAVVETESAAAWQRLWSADGWLREGTFDGAAEGDRYSVRMRTGDRLEGRIQFYEPPTDLLLTVENRERALLRVQVERCDGVGPMKIRLWLMSWTMADAERDRLQAAWQAELDRVFQVAGAA